MRTPAGTECRYYYEDFNRGREIQECRLIQKNPRSLPWSPDVCAKCAVPEILRANGSDDLVLTVTVGKKLGVRKTVTVEAECRRHDRAIRDPYLGCEMCRQEGDAPGLGLAPGL